MGRCAWARQSFNFGEETRPAFEQKQVRIVGEVGEFGPVSSVGEAVLLAAGRRRAAWLPYRRRMRNDIERMPPQGPL